MQTAVMCYGMTDVGRIRTANEDQFLIVDLDPTVQVEQTSLLSLDGTPPPASCTGKLLAIADGMGGQAGGARASSLVLASVLEYVLAHKNDVFKVSSTEQPLNEEQLAEAVRFCQGEILREAQQSPEYATMGTTLTMACVFGSRALLAHVGDSRCYLWHDRQLRQLTRDHTVAQQFLDRGDLEPAEVEHSRWNHVLWNALGADGLGATPELHDVSLSAGDRLLLCSDGLTRHVPAERISRFLAADPDPRGVCASLVQEANERGGQDNVTVIVANIGPQSADEPIGLPWLQYAALGA